ncbi:MAG: GTPase HflX [Lachnospiraceae bacterium]|nr:GTPase HflX [Lachnospiraceae bacterium]
MSDTNYFEDKVSPKDRLFNTEEEPERAILVSVCTDGNEVETHSQLKELEELLLTAGGVKVGEIVQNRDAVHHGTYIGKGKLEELKGLVEFMNADSVICDDELSPMQIKNLSDFLNVKVIDRTVLILDIFAKHAKTAEGRLQVELAQLNYNATHLTGSYKRMSRLGGGIGTRGPGEQKIEVDRRIIRNRIVKIQRDLEKLEKNREELRKKRAKESIPMIAIVGYTNAGKSTLLNKLTNAGVLSENKLFATLDPTTRRYTYEDGEEVLFTDTVGFVRKLPHNLIKAFKSTLMEAGYADIILHVADASNEDYDKHINTVYEVLDSLKINHENCITAFNKTDLIPEDEFPSLKDLKAKKTVRISAKTGEGIDKLLSIIKESLSERYTEIEEVFSYSDAGKIQKIRDNGRILVEEYREDGIYIKALITKRG